MIKVTRLNNTEFVISAELVETVEATPDTVITLTTERKYVVRESVDEIVARVIAFKRACMQGLFGGNPNTGAGIDTPGDT